MEMQSLTERDYAMIRTLLLQRSGIALGASKKALVAGRLLKRIQHLGLPSYSAYSELLASGSDPEEVQEAVELLTTNETYFFREPQHFALLAEIARDANKGKAFRVWSAACSSGEEVYTIAVTLQEVARKSRSFNWQVRGSDINTRMLEKAAGALYECDRIDGISPELLKRYFLQGTGPYEGQMLVDPALCKRVDFAQINLVEPLPELVPFDVIFLRNVMIYFEADVRRRVVEQLVSALTPDGVLIVGMAENLKGLVSGLVSIGPGAYRLERRRADT